VININNKGKALVSQGNYGGALTVFEVAICLVPSNKESWTNKGIALTALKK
jgi:Flp pilus assembly protein TadD